MIGDLAFERPDPNGVRRARFVARPSIPLGAACLVANGIREMLRDLFGEPCELTIGEPAAIDARAWQTLSNDAFCFLTCGRQTDIILVLHPADARTLVQRAFGETVILESPALSALELHALERIAGRCAATFDPLYAERRSGSQRIAGPALPACVAFFDVRVSAPVAIDIGVGVVRDLPDSGPARPFPPALLARVPLDVHVEFATGTIDARTFLSLKPGDIVRLDTQVGAAAGLKIADTYMASGCGGISGGHYSFELHSVKTTGAQS